MSQRILSRDRAISSDYPGYKVYGSCDEEPDSCLALSLSMGKGAFTQPSFLTRLSFCASSNSTEKHLISYWACLEEIPDPLKTARFETLSSL